MPGAIVILSVLYGLMVACNWSQTIKTGAFQTTLFAIAFFVVSYAVGNVLSLRAARHADKLSGMMHKLKSDTDPESRDVKNIIETFKDADEALTWLRTIHSSTSGAGSTFYEHSWYYEDFPYPCWSFIRLSRHCPEEVFRFYWEYREQVLAQVGSVAQFFNYCKMAVFCGDGKSSGPLALEIQEAESLVRFLAGAFDAFMISSSLLLTFIACDISPRTAWFAVLPLGTVLFLIARDLIPGFPAEDEGSSAKNKDNSSDVDSRVGQWMRPAFYFLLLQTVGSLIYSVVLYIHAPNAANQFLHPGTSGILGLSIVAFAEFLLDYGIVSDGRLRSRRHREVAAVMDAFYLTCGNPNRIRVARQFDWGKRWLSYQRSKR